MLKNPDFESGKDSGHSRYLTLNDDYKEAFEDQPTHISCTNADVDLCLQAAKPDLYSVLTDYEIFNSSQIGASL